MDQKKKLIEVALPLEAINKASAREKSIRHGHPSTLHLWWARRPLAAARAVIFAQMVDDPSAHPDIFKTEKAQEKERQRLFKIIEDLVQWENTTNEEVLQRARDEIWQSWRATCAENSDDPRAKELFDRHKLPAFHDPFAGGGALPLEAQRLGLEAYASDLNPVAVLINKAMIEIPPKFAGKSPVNPESRKKIGSQTGWTGARGLAEDVRYYGKWMRDEAEKRIGHLYPKIEITADMVKDRPDLKPYVGKKLTVIAWLWARTVKSPNPAFAKVDVPLVSSFMLCTKAGKEVYVDPVIEGDSYQFTVKTGKPKDPETAKNGTKLARGSFRCLLSQTPISYEYIDDEANTSRMGARLMAIVAEGSRGRVYLSPTDEMETIAFSAIPTWKPDAPSRGTWASNAQGRRYGFRTFGDYFTPRQLVALTTMSDLLPELELKLTRDALTAGHGTGDDGLEAGGIGAKAYADAVAIYLAFAVDKCSDYWSSICSWHSSGEKMRNTFGRQGIAMSWDYAEANPFCDSSGNWMAMVDWTWKSVEILPAKSKGLAMQADAQTQTLSAGRAISTDPPYYDNIGYADLSDFFYVWLRRALKHVIPSLFATLAVPKAEELIADSYRHGGKQNAEAFFLEGMTRAMRRLAEEAHPAFPVTIYYAFKQSEAQTEGIISSGWDTFLDALLRSGFAISGTWPIRTELANKLIGMNANMLASSIIIVSRPRMVSAPTATRREFVNALKTELPVALTHLQRGNIAPVDLAQAAIGPGMAVYTRYSKVLDAEGKPLSVREALALINQTLDEALAHQEGDFDADSRWALTWFEQSGFAEGEYGVAEQLSKSKNTSVAGMVEAGILTSKGGKVRLLKPAELPKNWDPADDERLTVWETVHQLVRSLEQGESVAAVLVSKLGSKAETARELAYRLYTLCERKKRTQEALSYNALVQSWPEIIRLARERGAPQEAELF
jgi:putative DNA methylase